MTFIIQSVAYKFLDRSAMLTKTPPDIGDQQELDRLGTLVTDKFEVDKVFLNEQLSLQSFSVEVGLPASTLSRIVNQQFGSSFTNIVAQYRLQEAKKIIRDTEEENIKLIDIAYDCGFNNKVSFYRTFKKWEGISPSDYVQKIKEEKK